MLSAKLIQMIEDLQVAFLKQVLLILAYQV